MSALYALVGLWILFLVIRAVIRDERRVRANRRVLRLQATVLSVASRATCLEEIPEPMLLEVRRRLGADDKADQEIA